MDLGTYVEHNGRPAVRPASRDLDVGFVDEPPVTRQPPTGAGSLDELECEPLHPPLDGHVIDADATLGEQLFDVAVGQAVTQVPAHRHCDHITWKTEASER
jgi:hypothetical protein